MENPYRNSLMDEEFDRRLSAPRPLLRLLCLDVPGGIGFGLGTMTLGGFIFSRLAGRSPTSSAILIGMLSCGFGFAWLQASTLWAREQSSAARNCSYVGALLLFGLLCCWLSLL